MVTMPPTYGEIGDIPLIQQGTSHIIPLLFHLKKNLNLKERTPYPTIQSWYFNSPFIIIFLDSR